MMRSLYSAVSGLKGHQTRMDVIGNNIANVNTTGFKSSRVTFEDMISQTLSGASKPSNDLGGTNPKQIGLGVGVGSIDLLFTDGSVQSTGKNTDLALSGNGLFIVNDGTKDYYTRDGAFQFDADGNYVLPSSGMYVKGWMASDGSLSAAGEPGKITIPSNKAMDAVATKKIDFTNNLNTDTTEYDIDTVTVNYSDGTSDTGITNYSPIVSAVISLKFSSNEEITLDDTATYDFTTTQAVAGKTLWTSKIKSVTANATGGVKHLTLGTGDVIKSINDDNSLTTSISLSSGTYKIGETYEIKGTIQTGGVNTSGVGSGLTTLKVDLTDAANKGKTVIIKVPNPENFSYSDGDEVSFSLPITGISAEKGAVVNCENNQSDTLQSDLDVTSTNQEYVRTGHTSDGTVTTVSRQSAGATFNHKQVSSVTINTKTGETLSGLIGAKYASDSKYYPPVTTTATIYDSQGSAYSVPIILSKTETNQWALSLTGGTNHAVITNSDGNQASLTLDADDIIFDTDGNYVSGTGKISVTYTGSTSIPKSDKEEITLNLAQLTQYSGETTVKPTASGHSAGTLSSVSIDSSGIITGTYTNGVKQTEAQVAVASFTNASGLEKTGNSLYSRSNNSGKDDGRPTVGTASALGVTITPSALEMSNVDIADQFTDMIVTQRGFQSNSKIITVDDELLETVINMKR